MEPLSTKGRLIADLRAADPACCLTHHPGMRSHTLPPEQRQLSPGPILAAARRGATATTTRDGATDPRPLERPSLRGRPDRVHPVRRPATQGCAAMGLLLRAAGPSTSVAPVPLMPRPPSARAVIAIATQLARDAVPARSMAADRLVTSRSRARSVDLFAALSTGLDLAGGHGTGHAQRTAYLALRLAGVLGVASEDRAALLYAALLKDAGRAGDIARRLGLADSVDIAIDAGHQRWDGRGAADGIAHKEIPLVGRILTVAEAAAIGLLGGAPVSLREGAISRTEGLLRARRGSLYDPGLVDLMLSMGTLGLWRELPTDGSAPRLTDLEPVELICMSDADGLDRAAATFADLVDGRTPRHGRHAARVGVLAARTATYLGLHQETVRDLRRAGLLHDIGKLGVRVGLLEKPAGLTSGERDALAGHPQASAAILERCAALAPLADLVRHHHARLDAPDRFPELETSLRSMAARVLAVADRYAGMTAARPYRAALSSSQALEILAATTRDALASEALRALGSIV